MKLALIMNVAFLPYHIFAAWGSTLPIHFDGYKINAIIKPAGEAPHVKGDPIEFVCEASSIHSTWLKNKNVDALTFNVGHAHRTKDSSSDRITAHNKLALIRIDAYDHLAVKGTLVIAAREGKPAENWVFTGMLTPVKPVKK